MASSTTETAQHLNVTHQMLKGAVDHLAQRRNLSDQHVNELRGVQKHLRDFKTHYEVAHSNNSPEPDADHKAMQLGGGALGKFNETATASEHLAEMHKSLTRAHNLLTGSAVYNAHKHKLTGPLSLPDEKHLAKQNELVQGLSYLGAGGKRKTSKGYNTFRVGNSKFSRSEEGHFVDEGGAKVTPEKIDELAEKFGESHPGIQKFRQADKGTRRTRQYDLRKPGSPKVGKGMGSAPQEVSDQPGIKKGQNTSGVVKDTVDPKKKASKGYRQADYAGASSEMGKKNPADVAAGKTGPTAEQQKKFRTRQGIEAAVNQPAYYEVKYGRGIREATKGPSYFAVKKVEDRKKAKRVGAFMTEQNKKLEAFKSANARRIQEKKDKK